MLIPEIDFDFLSPELAELDLVLQVVNEQLDNGIAYSFEQLSENLRDEREEYEKDDDDPDEIVKLKKVCLYFAIYSQLIP